MRENNDRSGIDKLLLGLLFITFLVLRLTSVINWSWWWITAPLWMPVVLSLVFLAIGYSILGIVNLIEKRKRR